MSKELLSLDVNAFTEKKGQLPYLSWAWAWSEVLKYDEQADWEAVEYPAADGTLRPCMFLDDGTAMVKTKVTIKGKTRVCTLPVMDSRNNAIKNPDARKISDAIMRCMTKAISMHGLALYIYAGEDLPQVIETEEEAKARQAWEKRCKELQEMCAFMVESHEAGQDLPAIQQWYDAKNWSPDNGIEQEERKFAWGLLPSKLRSTIKANKPEAKAE